MTAWEPPVAWTLADVITESGIIDRIVPFKHLRVPSVRLEGDRLIWGEPGAAAAAARIVPAGKKLLTDFVNLVDARPEEIAMYAQQWGVINVCEHDLPASHNPARITDEGRTTGCIPRRDDSGFWEPIAVWHVFARRARAILNIASLLKTGGTPPAEDWLVFRESVPGGVPQRRLALSFAVNRWLVLSNAQLLVSWDDLPDAAPLIHVAYPGLFGVLSLQLLTAVVGGPGFLFCSECGNGYFPTRRFDPNDRHYCPACRASGVPARNAKQAQRQRNRGKSER